MIDYLFLFVYFVCYVCVLGFEFVMKFFFNFGGFEVFLLDLLKVGCGGLELVYCFGFDVVCFMGDEFGIDKICILFVKEWLVSVLYG